jgi:hypothetical protein
VNAGTVSLWADNGGLPIKLLETFNVSNLPADDGSFHTPLAVTDPNRSLVAGQQYWVVASTTTSSHLSWRLNNTGVSGSTPQSPDGAISWFATLNTTEGAFEVTENVTPTNAVPEPASLTLLATGALGLLGYCWRRRRRGSAGC